MTTEFRDRIAAALHQSFDLGADCSQCRVALADADRLIAAGVVADPATLGHAYDKITELSRKGDEAVRERDRYRAALHDIAALLADEWRDEPPSTIYPDGRRLYRWPGDLRTELKDVLARQGIEAAALELPPNGPTVPVGHIDTEEPQP